MTQHGEAYENPIAERVNGILKTEFHLARVFKSRTEALLAVKTAIGAYNNIRSHMSCRFLTSEVTHLTNETLVKYWTNYRKNQEIQLLKTNINKYIYHKYSPLKTVK